jgi:hypothetical protein
MVGEIASTRKCAQCDGVQSAFTVQAAEGTFRRAAPL